MAGGFWNGGGVAVAGDVEKAKNVSCRDVGGYPCTRVLARRRNVLGISLKIIAGERKKYGIE